MAVWTVDSLLVELNVVLIGDPTSIDDSTISAIPADDPTVSLIPTNDTSVRATFFLFSMEFDTYPYATSNSITFPVAVSF